MADSKRLPADLAAVIFDLDGVITATAKLHFRAWKRLFDEVIARAAARDGIDERPFDKDDYLRHVDGRPRYDGVREFLRSRGITLPEGGPEDPPEAETVYGLGNRKNVWFNRLLREEGAEVFPGAVRLVEQLRARGIGRAVVSSSKNCRAILETARLTPLFDAIVDGNDAARAGLAGKPAPDAFLHAARLLGQRPADCAVAEDAISGVQAGAAGRFRLVIGVNRGAGAEALAAAGADIVVNDLGELSLE